MKNIILSIMLVQTLLTPVNAFDFTGRVTDFTRTSPGYALILTGPSIFATVMWTPPIGAAVSTVESAIISYAFETQGFLYEAETQEELIGLIATGETDSMQVETVISFVKENEEAINKKLEQEGYDTQMFYEMTDEQVAQYLIDFSQ